jgi:hypothetical protein
MPNPENFPNTIQVPIDIRPNRLNNSDTDLFQVGTQQVFFGSNIRDNIELWFYNPNGSLATHVTVDATDSLLGLNTVIDNQGAYEFVNIDMTQILAQIGLEQGRYQMIANFFRTEVGNEIGNKLYIENISPDRTELQLKAQSVDADIVRDIYEFTVPSVPKTTAQGLLDLVFSKTKDTTQVVNDTTVLQEMDLLIPQTSDKITNSHSYTPYATMVNQIIDQSYTLALDNMAADTNNLNIQETDLESYLRSAVQDVIKKYKDSGRVDPKFNIF